MRNFPIDSQSFSEMSDWEILCAHKYVRVLSNKNSIIGQEEYDQLLTRFENKETLDAWIYKLIKLFEHEYYTRHEN